MALSVDQVYRDFNAPNVPGSGEYEPVKAEIRALLKQIQNSGGQSITRNTLAALNAVTPPNEGYMGIVLTGAGAGYYSRVDGVWTFGRGFPDAVGRLTQIGGVNAITATLDTGVDPSKAKILYILPTSTNTGAVTLSIGGAAAKPVRSVTGDALTPGSWFIGRATMLFDYDTEYRLLSDPSGDAAAVAAGEAADRSERYAEEAEISANRASSYVPTGVAKALLGLVPFNSPTNPTTRIGVSPGIGRDKDNGIDISLVTGIEKRIDQNWAAGNGAGGRDVATAFPAISGVHIYIIRNPTTAAVDVLFSQSATSPVMPSGFSQRRRIGAFMLDTSAQPYAGIWYANGDFYYKSPINQGSWPAESSSLFTTLVPAGIKMQAHYTIVPDDGGSGNPAFGAVFSDPDLGPPPTNNLAWVAFWKASGTTGVDRVTTWTDTTAKVYAGGVFGRAASILNLYPLGWNDLRDEFS